MCPLNSFHRLDPFRAPSQPPISLSPPTPGDLCTHTIWILKLTFPQRDLVIAWSELDTHITNRQAGTLRS